MVIMMVVGHRRRAVGLALRAAGQILFVGGHLFGPDGMLVESPFGHENDQGSVSRLPLRSPVDFVSGPLTSSRMTICMPLWGC